MLKEYAVDGGLQWELAKRQLKRHPKWRKSKWIRRILFALCIVTPMVGALIGYRIRIFVGSDGIVDTFDRICGSVIFFLTFGAFPWLVAIPYFAVLRGKCFDESNYKSNETLCLTDDGIQNVFLPSDEMSSDAMFEEQ